MAKKGRAVERQKAGGGVLWADGFGPDARASLISHFINSADFLKAYRTVPWLHAAMYVKASAASAVRWHVKSGGEIVEENELTALLRRPNDYQSYADMLSQMILHLDAAGNALLLKDQMNGLGQPASLHVLIPSRVQLIRGPFGIEGYRYTVNGQQRVYARDEVMHFRYPNPDDALWGIGRVEVGIRKLDLDRYVSEWALAHFANGAKPGGVIRTDTDNFEQNQKIAAQFRANHQGPQNSNRTAVLPKSYEYIPFESNPINNALIEIDAAGRDSILSLIGTPKQKIGIFEDANYRSTDADNYFYAEVIVPLLESRFLPTLNIELAARYDCELEYEDVDVEDKNASAERAQKMFATGSYTRDEIRAETGHDPLDGDIGSTLVGPLSVASLGTAPAKQVSRSAAKAQKPDGAKLSEARQAYIEAVLPVWKAAVARLFEAEAKDVIERIEGKGKARGKFAFTAEQLYDTDAATDAWMGLMLGLYDGLGEGVTGNLSPLFPDLAWDASDPIVSTVLDQIARRAEGSVKSVPATTLDAIRDTVTEAQKRGYSLDQLVNGVSKPDEKFTGIRGLYKDFAEGPRAETIARTELGAAYNRIANHQYEQEGVTEVEALDGDYDSDCAARNGQRFSMDQANRLLTCHPNGTLTYVPVVG